MMDFFFFSLGLERVSLGGFVLNHRPLLKREEGGGGESMIVLPHAAPHFSLVARSRIVKEWRVPLRGGCRSIYTFTREKGTIKQG